jgi:glycosyltransferase involved in cell wall biosynthesis
MLNENILTRPKVMLLTKQLDDYPTSGRELLCKLNYDALREMYGELLVLYELPRRSLHGASSILSAFKGHIDGLDDLTITNALQIIRFENVGKVFVDGSNLGAFVKAVKEWLPHVEVITFFHNVEARFFLGSLREKKSIRALAVLIVNYVAERKSINYSDKIICMSTRDSCLLRKVYGRSATHLSSMALQDKMPLDISKYLRQPAEKFALFVGGVFYANLAGITWFVKHVVPRIHIKVYIVGRGFEAYRTLLEREGKVQIVGAVDDLSAWYRNAHFVIAPIFDGSGMKTKVAEALMYGKKIVGTKEAFSGYEDIAETAGWICTSANDFVGAILQAQSIEANSFDQKLRDIYEDKYSFDAAKSRLKKIIELK